MFVHCDLLEDWHLWISPSSSWCISHSFQQCVNRLAVKWPDLQGRLYFPFTENVIHSPWHQLSLVLCCFMSPQLHLNHKPTRKKDIENELVLRSVVILLSAESVLNSGTQNRGLIRQNGVFFVLFPGSLAWLDGSDISYSNWVNMPDEQASCGHILRHSGFQWEATGNCSQELNFICQFGICLPK